MAKARRLKPHEIDLLCRAEDIVNEASKTILKIRRGRKTRVIAITYNHLCDGVFVDYDGFVSHLKTLKLSEPDK